MKIIRILRFRNIFRMNKAVYGTMAAASGYFYTCESLLRFAARNGRCMLQRVALREHDPVTAVLMSLATQGAAARTQLAANLGLSAATLTRAVQVLSKKGLISESRVDGAGPGRPLSLVSLVPSCVALMGVKLTDTHAWAVVIDPAGSLLAQITEPLVSTLPHEVAAQISVLVKSLSEKCGKKIQGIGISLGAGVVGGRIVRVASFLGWRDVPFAALVTEATGLPVCLANDVRAFAYCEAWYGVGKDEDPFALLSVGAGIGCAIVVGGHALAGAHGAAGSVGHLPISPDGPSCEYGHRGCARALASTPGMLARAQELFGKSLDLAQLVALDAQGNGAAKQILQSAAHALGMIAGALIAIADPSFVLISGEAAYAIAPYEADLRAGVEQARHWSAPTTKIRICPFTFIDWARGAAALAVEPWAQSVQAQA